MTAAPTPDAIPDHARTLVSKHSTSFYNLGEEQWIPVELLTGELSLYGFEQTLRDAHLIKDIALTNPLEKAVILRYLIALTYVVHSYQPTESLWEAVVSGDSGLPLDGVNRTIERVKSYWNLLDPDRPFMQSPSVPEWLGSKPGESVELDHPASLLPFAPRRSNEAWFGKELIENQIKNEKLPLALLMRHFCMTPGNEGKASGTGKSSQSGGLFLVGQRNLSHFFRQSCNLAATLASNLTERGVDAVTTDAVLFWEASLEPAKNSNDWLYLYTSSPVTAYLIPGSQEDTSPMRVRRVPYPLDSEVMKRVGVLARLQDPHTLRIKKKGTTGGDLKDWSFFYADPSATQAQNLFSFYRNCAESLDLGSGVFNTTNLRYKAPSVRTDLLTLSLDVGGTSTGARLESVSLMPLNPAPYLLSDSDAKSIRAILNLVASSQDSIRTKTAHHVKVAMGLQGAPLPKAVAKKLEIRLWLALNEELQTLINEALVGKVIKEIPMETKRRWVDLSIAVFEDLCSQYKSSANSTTQFYRSKASLRRSLWKKIMS